MTLTNSYPYSNYLDALDDENNALGLSMHLGQFALPFPLDPSEYPGIFPLPSVSGGGLSSTYLAPDPLLLNSGPLNPPSPFDLSQTHHSLRSPPTEIAQKSNTEVRQISQSPPPTAKRRIPKLRRQNRSCDPCRSAKRACDLSLNATISNNVPSSPCSMCKLRGTDCTVTWRMSKESSRNAKNLPSNHCHDAVTQHPEDSLPPIALASCECNLTRSVLAREARSQRLGAYIDIFDIPVSNILEKCMPPCYSLGIAALTPLSHGAQLATLFNQAQSMIRNCWEMGPSTRPPIPTASRLFLTASILDVLLQTTDCRSGHVQFSLRDRSLTETHMWVAIATGSQFAAHQHTADDTGMSRQQTRDIAYATWCKAKQMVFANISESKSFRLALSLLLFGTILPPTESDQSYEFGKDAAYALHEGICRLQNLCAEARACFRSFDIQSDITTRLGRCNLMRKPCLLQSLPVEIHKNVLELIASFEWFADMAQSIAIALFPDRSLTVAPSISILKAYGTHQIEDIIQLTDGKDDNGRNSKSIEDAIIARVKAESQPVTVLCTQDLPDHIVDSAIGESGSLVVLMWKSLARLTLATRNLCTEEVDYEEIRQYLNAMMILVDIWRASFGPIDRDTATSLHLATTLLRRNALFCAIDGDLPVLVFYDLCSQLRSFLEDEPRSPSNSSLREALKLTNDRRYSQRLTSAIQISYLASKHIGNLSPGFEGKAGLKADIEDVRAHPVRVIRLNHVFCC